MNQFTNHQTNGDDCRESGEGETMREQFEAWIVSMPRYTEGDIKKRADGQYEYMETEWCFRAWKASRAAIEIHLPGEFRESYQSSNMVMDAEAVKERLADAGINFME